MTDAAKVSKYGPVVAEVVSQRTGETYQVRRQINSGQLSCNCKAWAFSKGMKACKHTRAFTFDGPAWSDQPVARVPTPRPVAQPVPAAFLAIERTCHASLAEYVPTGVILDLTKALKLALGPHLALAEPPATAVAPAVLPGVRRIVLAD